MFFISLHYQLLNNEIFLASFKDKRPKLVDLPIESQSMLNISHVILCNLLQGTQPVHFEWTKNGQIIDPDHTKATNWKIDSTDNFSMLTIPRLDQYDSAIYKCIARNAYGYDSTTTKLRVQGK